MIKSLFSKAAGYNLTKERLNERFFHIEFVRTCHNGNLLGQLLMNDSVSFRHLLAWMFCKWGRIINNNLKQTQCWKSFSKSVHIVKKSVVKRKIYCQKFYILGCWSWSLGFLVLGPGSRIPSPGALGPESWGAGSYGPGSWVLGPGVLGSWGSSF